jgi:hypothetical protein
MANKSTSEKVSSFLQWFEAIDSAEQEILMTMVYKEKRIRDVVNSLAGMAQEQRQEVFQRLGLPVDLVARIPPPDPAALNDVEVEWEDWKAPGTTP